MVKLTAIPEEQGVAKLQQNVKEIVHVKSKYHLSSAHALLSYLWPNLWEKWCNSNSCRASSGKIPVDQVAAKFL